MKVENLAYPWKDDFRVLEHEIETLKMEIQNLKNTNDNLKYFCQQLYDRLNLREPNYASQAIYKP